MYNDECVFSKPTFLRKYPEVFKMFMISGLKFNCVFNIKDCDSFEISEFKET